MPWRRAMGVEMADFAEGFNYHIQVRDARIAELEAELSKRPIDEFGMLSARIATLEAALAEAREVIRDLTPSERGAHGGQLVGADVYYEDGDKAHIYKAPFARARAWLERHGEGQK